MTTNIFKIARKFKQILKNSAHYEDAINDIRKRMEQYDEGMISDSELLNAIYLSCAEVISQEGAKKEEGEGGEYPSFPI